MWEEGLRVYEKEWKGVWCEEKKGMEVMKGGEFSKKEESRERDKRGQRERKRRRAVWDRVRKERVRMKTK
jgi:hypothetical protein